MILLNSSSVKKVDNYLINELGYSLDILIESAGLALYNHLLKFLSETLPEKRIRRKVFNVFFGPGNNGKDVLVTARLLKINGYKVFLWKTFDDINYASLQYNICKNIGIDIKNSDEYKSDDNQVNIDGIFGSSFDTKRNLDANFKKLFLEINSSKEKESYVISADIPSGVNSDNGDALDCSIRSDLTITFIAPKIGNVSWPGKGLNGRLVIDNLNIPNKFLYESFLKNIQNKYNLIDSDYVYANMPKRKQESHKGTYGKIGIIAGSRNTPGAAILSALGAMRSGCGIVYLYVTQDILSKLLKIIPEAVISDDSDYALNKSDVLLIGPGIEETKDNMEIILKAILEHPKLILDAGALNVLAKDIELSKKAFLKRFNNNLNPVILTPHPKELDRLIPLSLKMNRLEATLNSAKNFKSIVLLKGNATVIASPSGDININSSGNSSLAKAGSGDVLAGIISALYALIDDPLIAASLGVFIHGQLGEMCSDEKDETSVLPTDLIDKLPIVFKAISKGAI